MVCYAVVCVAVVRCDVYCCAVCWCGVWRTVTLPETAPASFRSHFTAAKTWNTMSCDEREVKRCKGERKGDERERGGSIRRGGGGRYPSIGEKEASRGGT